MNLGDRFKLNKLVAKITGSRMSAEAATESLCLFIETMEEKARKEVERDLMLAVQKEAA